MAEPTFWGLMKIVENSYTSLKAIGKDEQWLHKWIIEKPSRLGLGDMVIKNSVSVHGVSFLPTQFSAGLTYRFLVVLWTNGKRPPHSGSRLA